MRKSAYSHRLDLLTASAFLSAMALLLLNDWVWKAQYGNWLTGKLSDFAGLFMFPIFWTAIFPKHKRLIFTIVATFFIFWKSPFSQFLIESWNGLGMWQIARVVDFSDNIALLSLVAAYMWVARQHGIQPRFRLHPSIPLLISSFAFAATSMPPRYFQYDLGKYRYEFDMPKAHLVETIGHIEGVKISADEAKKKREPEKYHVRLQTADCVTPLDLQVSVLPINTGKTRIELTGYSTREFCYVTAPKMVDAFERRVVEPLRTLPSNFLDISRRVDSLLAKMTLEEKIGQLTLYTTDWGSTGPTIREGYKNDIRSGACGNLFNSHTVGFVRDLQKVAVEETRLKIPLLFGFDVIHGYKTIFPIPLGEAASWDLEAIEKSARVASAEAAAAGLNWTYAPMVDISREPRWGRVMEGAGEDTWLGSRIAEARVRGIQGKKIGDTDAMLACVKHFAGYGAPIAGRDYNTVDMSERYFREFYLPPYEAAVRAGAATVMTSFNDYDGVPATGNKHLLTNILRNEWGFQGFVVTDYTSINEMVNHGVVANDKEAGELALNAGVDMDMQGAVYQRFLAQSVKEGMVKMEDIDKAVRRILRLKFELGLFENPYRFCDENREKTVLLSKENRAAARDVSRKSIVLLKNERNILPLNKNQKIALIGPLADNKSELIGNWNGAGNANDCVSLQEGIANLRLTNLTHAKGCEVEGTDQSGFAEALRVAQNADIVVVAVGEKAMMSGEAAARADITLPGVQEALVLELVKTGKPVVVILMNGRPLAIPKIAESAAAILETWWLGTEAGNAIADVLFGNYNPSGKLPMTFPRSVGQVPIFYNEKSTGRPYDPNSKWTSKYIDSPNSPQWPFGFGLSYTTFSYDEPKPDKLAFKKGESLQITVNVTNTGSRAGEEVVQLYVRDLVGSVTRPVKELKGFQKMMLKAGETRTVTFALTERDLSFYRQDMTFGTEPGEFEIMVGGNSEEVKKVRVRMTE